MKRSPLSIEDLLRFRVPTSLAWSPDGRRLALTIEVQQPELEGMHSHLHVFDLQSRSLQAYSRGKRRDARARWSADGRWIYITNVEDGEATIARIPADGGAEENLFRVRGQIGGFDLSTDQRWLVFAMRRADPKGPVLAHRITRNDYKEDGTGFRPQDRWGIHVLELRDGARPRRLSAARHDAIDPALAPNGREVAYVSWRHRRSDMHGEHQELVCAPLTRGRERVVPTPPGPVATPSWSPDGRRIAYVGHAQPDEPWEVVNRHVWVVGRAGRPKARDLMPRFDRGVGDRTVGDVGVFPARRGPLWSADGRRIYFLVSEEGSTRIRSVGSGVRPGSPRAHGPAKAHVKLFDLHRKRIASVRADLHTPGELHVEDEQVHACNAFLREERALARISEHWIRCDDGELIQGWLYRPPRPRGRLPAILSIHGGPVAQYGYGFLHELHWLALRGYAILACNPRGGIGRGEAFARSIVGDWGNRDFRDLMQASDWLAARSFVDPKRLGVMGGSYGGYMTNWIVAHDQRFRAAVTQRSLSDLRSSVGSSDIGHTWPNEFGSAFWERPEVHERLSPIAHVAQIRTPLLILHSLADLRSGVEQAETLFTALRALGRPVEMLLFPEENHDLSRSGRFARRKARLEAIGQWFERHL